MKLNVILSVLSVFVLLTLSACSQKEYHFYGSSDNWIVTYDTEISEERTFADFSFEYIGEEPAPEMFDYNLKSKWMELRSKEERFNHQDKNITSGGTECTGPPINADIICDGITEDEKTIEAKIEWNGNSEVVVLNKK